MAAMYWRMPWGRCLWLSALPAAPWYTGNCRSVMRDRDTAQNATTSAPCAAAAAACSPYLPAPMSDTDPWVTGDHESCMVRHRTVRLRVIIMKWACSDTREWRCARALLVLILAETCVVGS